MKRIVFYGDSNTYGYDPRGFLGMRYPEEIRWTSMIWKHFKGEYEIIEEGQNGRCLPRFPGDESFLKRITGMLTKNDIFVVMLGTNDILLTDHPDADMAIERMNRLLTWLVKNHSPFSTIIIGPVPVANAEGELQIYYKESLRLNAGYQKLCQTHGVIYYDAAEWNIPTAFDGVHFSEEGCRRFASKMIEICERQRKE